MIESSVTLIFVGKVARMMHRSLSLVRGIALLLRTLIKVVAAGVVFLIQIVWVSLIC